MAGDLLGPHLHAVVRLHPGPQPRGLPGLKQRRHPFFSGWLLKCRLVGWFFWWLVCFFRGILPNPFLLPVHPLFFGEGFVEGGPWKASNVFAHQGRFKTLPGKKEKSEPSTRDCLIWACFHWPNLNPKFALPMWKLLRMAHRRFPLEFPSTVCVKKRVWTRIQNGLRLSELASL